MNEYLRETVISKAIYLYEHGRDWKSYLQMFCIDDAQFNKVFRGMK